MGFLKRLFGGSSSASEMRQIPGLAFAITANHVRQQEVQSVSKVLDVVCDLTAKHGRAYFIELSFDGFDRDTRPIDQIPEVVAWSKLAQQKYPELMQWLTPGAMLRHLMCVIPELFERLPDGRVSLNLGSAALREVIPVSSRAAADRLRRLGMSDADIVAKFETAVAQNFEAALQGRHELGKDYGVFTP